MHDKAFRRFRSKMLLALTAASIMIFLNSCQNIHKTPDGCVVAFIVAAEQRDMTKAWNVLSPEVQKHYNGLGEKMRKSGKGALENEIARIKKFRSVKSDYRIQIDTSESTIVDIIITRGPTHRVETTNIEGDYKIKDEVSLRNLLSAITERLSEPEGY